MSAAAKRLHPSTLRRLDEIEEVVLETRRAPRGRPRRTTIWIVVEGGAVYVRSIRGSRGVWYRELRAHPRGTLRLSRARLHVRATPVRDAAANRRVSAAFRRKYARSPSLWSVVARHTLSGTLRLDPA